MGEANSSAIKECKIKGRAIWGVKHMQVISGSTGKGILLFNIRHPHLVKEIIFWSVRRGMKTLAGKQSVQT